MGLSPLPAEFDIYLQEDSIRIKLNSWDTLAGIQEVLVSMEGTYTSMLELGPRTTYKHDAKQ